MSCNPKGIMEHNRYLRQTTLPTFGEEGQRKLAASKVLVIGLGGLGVPVVQYLNAMGVHTLGLVDGDVIDLQNLQRQVLYDEHDIGQSKITISLRKLRRQNSTTTINGFHHFLSRDNALEIIKGYDLVIDATDNFSVRYLINDACVILGKPFVYGALHGFEGHVSVFNYDNGPTYRCLFPNEPSAASVPDCNENGVLGVVPGIVGTLQAIEAVKVLTGIGKVLSGELLVFDGLYQRYKKITFTTKPENKHISQLKESYGSFNKKITAESISWKEFFVRNQNNDAQLIDVRTEKEFKEGHLTKSLNIPLAVLQERLQYINFKRPVYLVCQSGKRSDAACVQLKKLNVSQQLFSIHGGLNALQVYGAR